MKKIGYFVLFIVVLFGVYFYIHRPVPQNHPLSPYCLPQDLQATLITSPGAGNIYETFTIKNISPKTCSIVGNNFISPTYDTGSIKNIAVTHIGKSESAKFNLVPNKTIYSQVHYPNGPQCQSQTRPTNVMFTYKISPKLSVTFAGPNGEKEQIVMTCVSSDITIIEIWNMSAKPITP